MRFLRLLGLLAPLLLVAALWWRSGVGAQQLRYYAPEEYVRRADAFIRARYLRSDCSESAIRPRLRLSGDIPVPDRMWYENSYLAEDVRNFNNDPESYGWTFVIDDDCYLRGVNPTVHLVSLPFARPSRWLGTIFYSDPGADAQLRAAARTITLRRSEKPVAAKDQATTPVGGAQDVGPAGSVLLHFVGGKSQQAARVLPVSGGLLLRNQTRVGQSEEARLMGHQLPVGRIVRLETGDWLFLRAQKPRPVEETFVVLGPEKLVTASVMRQRNDRFDRETDDARLGVLPGPNQERSLLYLDLVAASIDSSLASLPEERARELSRSFDLRLSVRRDFQNRLGEVFRGFCLQKQREKGLSRVFPAGVTVQDGLTGDVMALASFPWEEDVTAFPPEDTATRRRLLRNQNLVLHPIGSAGKPFFYAAIAHTFPFLMSTVIEPYPASEKLRDVLHCEMEAGYKIPAGSGGPVDFRTALGISSNKYTVDLAALAMAASSVPAGTAASGGSLESLIPRDREIAWPLPGRSSGVQINGQTLGYAPDLGGFVFRENRRPQEPESSAAERCLSIDRFDEVRFREPLGLLTGADTYWGRDPVGLPSDPRSDQFERGYKTNRYDLMPWSPLLRHLSVGADEDQAWKIRASAQAISPERVNLAFNQITRMRGDFTNLLLGGGTSIWTNVQLTEAMSRLVTGRAVDARFAAEVLPRPQPNREGTAPPAERVLAPEIPILPAARTAVLEGISRVVQPGGTAAALQDEIRQLGAKFPDSRIDVFSKTGSPIIERRDPRNTALAMEQLVRRGRLALEGGTLVVKAGGATAPHRAPGFSGRAEFLRTLTRALQEVQKPTTGWLVAVLMEYMDDFAGDLRNPSAETPESPLYADRGVLRLNRDHRLFQARLLPVPGAVYVFSVVRRPAGAPDVPTPAEFSDPRTKVITVAIFLELGPDSKVAVAAAERILPELAPLLE
jgi:cell division protein FtsI/penicillin-binding protein 2